jgi:hypothetical protein
MVWRADLEHPGLRALHDAIDVLTAARGWLRLPRVRHPERADSPGGRVAQRGSSGA